MGNSESSDVSSNHVRKGDTSRSPTRDSKCRSLSVRRPGPSKQTTNGHALRRSRTTRYKDGGQLRKVVCPVTGLTLHQKALLSRKWNRMDRGTIYEMGRRMFERVFNENAQYLAYIELKDEPNWWNHINFKIHVQRFVIVLTETMRRLKEPSTSIDVLRDFGAIYAKYPKRVSAMYFERIANSMNEAAAQLQESDHLIVEKSQNRMEEAATDSSSTDNTSNICSSCATPSLSVKHPLQTRFSESYMQTLREENSSYCSSCVPSRRGSENGKNSICPITADAWLALSAFIANQIKFGYELEKLLIAEMSKLGIDTMPCKIGPDETEIENNKKNQHHSHHCCDSDINDSSQFI